MLWQKAMNNLFPKILKPLELLIIFLLYQGILVGGGGGWLNLELKFLGMYLFFGTPFVIVALSGVLDVMDSLVLVDGGDSTPGSLIT